ncbi:unnamed protein product, partial [Ascophyllum nodosum]
QQQSGQSALQPVLINKSKFLKATYCTKIRNPPTLIRRNHVSEGEGASNLLLKTEKNYWYYRRLRIRSLEITSPGDGGETE